MPRRRWAPRRRGRSGRTDRVQRATPSGTPATEAYPANPCQETRPASHLQKLLCFPQIVTEVLLIPTAGLGASSTRVLWGSPTGFEGWPSLVRDIWCPCPQVSGTRALGGLGARVEGGHGTLAGRRGVWWQEKGLGQDAGLGFRPGRASGLPTAPVAAAPTRLHRGSPLWPILYFPKFTGCGISAQSHWRCVLDFFLSFQIFFLNKVFF